MVNNPHEYSWTQSSLILVLPPYIPALVLIIYNFAFLYMYPLTEKRFVNLCKSHLVKVRTSIKNYEDNLAVYHILFIKVITNILVYAIFILLKNEVSLRLIKKVFLLSEFKININKIRITKEKTFKYYDIIDILDSIEAVFSDA